MMDRWKRGMCVGAGALAAMALAGFGITACSDSPSSGSSRPQPVCDGSAASGSVLVSFSSCVQTVSMVGDCPTKTVCTVRAVNNNAQDITVRVDSGSSNIAPLQFDVLTGMTDSQMVDYTCPAMPIDESGTLDVNVSLLGGPGAFCGLDESYQITIAP